MLSWLFGGGDPNSGLRNEVNRLDREVPQLKETSKLMKKKASLFEKKYSALAEIAEAETLCIASESAYRAILAKQHPIRAKALATADLAEAKSASQVDQIANDYRQKFREVQADRPKLFGIF